GVLRERKDVLYGILNGVDYRVWNPETDRLIPANYSAGDLSGKETCKKELLKAFDLKLRPGSPLIGMVSRLDAQKGFDILLPALPGLMKLSAGLVILGGGSRKYEELLAGTNSLYPKKLSIRIGVDDALAHLIEAGSDMLLMPSRYEPCGLNQIYGLRYGAIPVVRATGGLDDTVRDWSEGQAATGFKFIEYSSKALIQKVREAVSVYKDKKAWERLINNAMKEHFSWDDSAIQYMEVYKKIKREKEEAAQNLTIPALKTPIDRP
ncbi:MAG: glycosyltransferase, partial [Deltaproteobacteria bacterium]|nr:glycosyltransferase [Deltaproteobacteria bacterium]